MKAYLYWISICLSNGCCTWEHIFNTQHEGKTNFDNCALFLEVATTKVANKESRYQQLFAMRTTSIPTFLILLLFCQTETFAADVSGFEFGDNRGTKYVTEENGVAVARFQE